MRIAQIMFGKQFGGAERSFVDLSRELARRGHVVRAVCQPGSVAAAQLARSSEVEVTELKVYGWWDALAVLRLGNLLSAFEPDVVHAHLARAAHLGGKAIRRADLPLLVKTHDYVDLKYYREVDFFVATTTGQRDYLLRHAVPPESTCVIPNFSCIAPAPVRRPDSQAAPRIVGCGRMVTKKGFDVLLQALHGLAARGQTFTATLAGDGPERARLERLGAAPGAGSKIAFSGWCDDVQGLLGTADLFVLPSREEPFGIALLEAMAAGVPIVATRTDGPLAILDEDTAFFADPGDRGSLEQAILDALARPDECVARATRAQQRFLDHYSAARVVPQYLAVYQRLRAGRVSIEDPRASHSR